MSMGWGGSATLASSLDGGTPELSGRGIKRGVHGLLRLRALHSVQQIAELRDEVIESAGARLHQRLELLVGDEHGPGPVVARDRHGATSDGFVQYRAKFVFDLGCRDGGDID